MAKPKVALQLYSVRNECKEDLAGTLAKVAAMGYEGVEFAGFHEHEAADVRKMLADNGLAVAGAHVALPLLQGGELPRTAAYHQEVGNRNLVIPWLTEAYRGGKDVWLSNARSFGDIAAKLGEFGLRTGYHNHNFEFIPLDGGDGKETAWDILFANIAPEFIMQLDTGNSLEGGADASVYLARYPNRAHTIHLKEYPDALIGDGQVRWPEIFRHCEEQSTEWYIVEQEGDLYPPLEYVDRWLKGYREMREAG